MNRKAIEKLTDADLLLLIGKLIDGAEFTADNAVELHNAIAVAKQRKSIFIGFKTSMSKRVTDPLQAITDAAPADGGVEVNLTVLDKESCTEIEGLKKYTLGFALDSTKAFDGDNMVEAIAVVSKTDAKVGSVVCMKAASVSPAKMENGFFTASIAQLTCFEVKKEKPHSAKEIIRKAHKAGRLELSQELAVDLNRLGILKVDIDKEFGVNLDKALKFKKTSLFGENGVVYCIVYPVNEVDTDGDSAAPEEVLKACWRFMENYQRLNFMHRDPLTDDDVSIVECAVALSDVPELGFKKGDWYMAVRVKNPELKAKIESGEITGFSMEGTAVPAGTK